MAIQVKDKRASPAGTSHVPITVYFRSLQISVSLQMGPRMFHVMLTILTIEFLAMSPTFSDDQIARPTADQSVRCRVQPYIDWLPAEAESLIIVRQPYRIPPTPDKVESTESTPSGIAFHEMYFDGMFDDHVREVLVGHTIDVWIEASTRFRFPKLADDVGHVPLTGWGLKYDGCHVVVFDDQSSLNTDDLFKRLLRDLSEQNPDVPRGVRHQIEQQDTIAYTPSHLYGTRVRASGETAEVTRKLDAAWSTTYWIASPRKNILLIATSRSFLAETLRKMQNPDRLAFSESLEEWEHLSGNVPIWGMRHFKERAKETDFSDLRYSTGYDATGIAFEISPDKGSGTIVILNCNPKAIEGMQSIIRDFVSAGTVFTEKDNGTLVAQIDWSEQPPKTAQRIQRLLGSWIQMYFGHWFAI